MDKIKEQYCTFPVCKLARDLGFDDVCSDAWEYYEYGDQKFGPVELGSRPLLYQLNDPKTRALMDDEEARFQQSRYAQSDYTYSNHQLYPWWYARPTQDQLERWLRDKHGIYVLPSPTFYGGKVNGFIVTICYGSDHDFSNAVMYDSWEGAREAGLFSALNKLKDANK